MNGVDLFRVDESGPAAISLNINSITNLPESLAAKQPLLSTEAGLSVSQTVKDTFALASSGDGVNHSTSLLTAKAVEDWFESLMPNLVTIQSGQTGNAVRVSTINSASTSAVNLPSCSAVANHVTYRLASYLTSVPSEYHTHSLPFTPHTQIAIHCKSPHFTRKHGTGRGIDRYCECGGLS